MEILDNINRLLGDDLKQVIQPGSKLRIAASCFSIYAFEALKAELATIDSLQFIFTSPTFVPDDVTELDFLRWLCAGETLQSLQRSSFNLRTSHEVFFVDSNALAACFDPNITEDLVKELAQRKPLRAVFRDSSYASDSTKINVAQIFKLLSPETEVKSL